MCTPTAWGSSWRERSLTHGRAHIYLRQTKQRLPAGRVGKVALLSYRVMVQARLPPGTLRALLLLFSWEATGAPFLVEANVKWVLETSTVVSAKRTMKPMWKKKLKKSLFCFLLFSLPQGSVCKHSDPDYLQAWTPVMENLPWTLKLPKFGSEQTSSPSAQAPHVPASGRVSRWPDLSVRILKHWKRISVYRQEHGGRFPDF